MLVTLPDIHTTEEPLVYCSGAGTTATVKATNCAKQSSDVNENNIFALLTEGDKVEKVKERSKEKPAGT